MCISHKLPGASAARQGPHSENQSTVHFTYLLPVCLHQHVSCLQQPCLPASCIAVSPVAERRLEHSEVFAESMCGCGLRTGLVRVLGGKHWKIVKRKVQAIVLNYCGNNTLL